MALGSDGPGGNHGQFLLSGRCKAKRISTVGSRHTNTRSLAVSFFFFFFGANFALVTLYFMDGPPPQLSTFCVPVCCKWLLLQKRFFGRSPNCSLHLSPSLLLDPVLREFSTQKNQWFRRCWGSLLAYFTSCQCLELGRRDTGIVVVGGKDHLNAGRFVFEPQFGWSDFGVPKFASRLGFG